MNSASDIQRNNSHAVREDKVGLILMVTSEEGNDIIAAQAAKGKTVWAEARHTGSSGMCFQAD